MAQLEHSVRAKDLRVVTVRTVWWAARRSPARTALYLAVTAVPVWALLALNSQHSSLLSPGKVLFSLTVAAGLVSGSYLEAIVRHSHGTARRIGPIDTERLHLRRFRTDDLTGLAATIDDEVIEANGWEKDPTDDWRAAAASGRNFGGMPDYWMITDRQTEAILGVLSARPLKAPETCEIGWWMGPAARDAGYATEAVAGAIAALHGGGYRHIRCGTREDNIAVLRILEKVGASRAASTTHRLPNGEVIASAWYVHEG